jgi:DNA-binding NarL/FixJ family response regulator
VLSDDEWTTLGRKMKLTPREIDILRGVCDEQSNEVIARELGISPNTVRTHLERLYRKCQYRSRHSVSAQANSVRIHRSARFAQDRCRESQVSSSVRIATSGLDG